MSKQHSQKKTYLITLVYRFYSYTSHGGVLAAPTYFKPKKIIKRHSLTHSFVFSDED